MNGMLDCGYSAEWTIIVSGRILSCLLYSLLIFKFFLLLTHHVSVCFALPMIISLHLAQLFIVYLDDVGGKS